MNPLEGAYCGYQDNDGCYYRVRVMKFSQPLGLYFHHKEQARVGGGMYLSTNFWGSSEKTNFMTDFMTQALYVHKPHTLCRLLYGNQH